MSPRQVPSSSHHPNQCWKCQRGVQKGYYDGRLGRSIITANLGLTVCCTEPQTRRLTLPTLVQGFSMLAQSPRRSRCRSPPPGCCRSQNPNQRNIGCPIYKRVHCYQSPPNNPPPLTELSPVGCPPTPAQTQPAPTRYHQCRNRPGPAPYAPPQRTVGAPQGAED